MKGFRAAQAHYENMEDDPGGHWIECLDCDGTGLDAGSIRPLPCEMCGGRKERYETAAETRQRLADDYADYIAGQD